MLQKVSIHNQVDNTRINAHPFLYCTYTFRDHFSARTDMWQLAYAGIQHFLLEGHA